jgi:hypothetical protein
VFRSMTYVAFHSDELQNTGAGGRALQGAGSSAGDAS